MAAVTLADNTLYMVRKYERGETITQIAEELSIDPSTVFRRLVKAGVQMRGSEGRGKWEPPDREALVADYTERELSISELSAKYGVSRHAIRERLKEYGVRVRDLQEATLIKMSQNPDWAYERASKGGKGNIGISHSMEHLVKIAAAKMRRGGFDSFYEEQLHEMVTQRGLTAIPQWAIGPYNVDLGIGEARLAVEVYGTGHYKKIAHNPFEHAARIKEILNAGWSMVGVWFYNHHHGLQVAAADYVVALTQISRALPASGGQYWMVWCDGKPIAGARREMDDFAFIPPPRNQLRSSRRYKGAGE